MASESQKNDNKTPLQQFRDCVFEIIEKPEDAKPENEDKSKEEDKASAANGQKYINKEELKNKENAIKSANIAVNYFLIALISLNAIAVIFSSVDDIQNRYNRLFSWFEYFSIIIFTIEYVLRLWTAKNLYPEAKNPYLKYICSGYAIIDLLAFLPFYFPLILPVDLRVLRLLRLVRMLRVLKLIRYNDSLGMITKVLKREKDKLFIAFIFILILILVSSSVLYFLENEAQPDKFPNIPATFWWAVATLTTVGYGDVYPITVLGKLLAGFIAILAIGLVALPSGIISAGLIKEIKKEKFKYNPDEIIYFFQELKKLEDNICNVCDEIAEKLQNESPGLLIQKNQKSKSRWYSTDYKGSSINQNNDYQNIFCGLSLIIVNSKENENDDFTYGLRIKKEILPDWERIDKKEFSYILVNNFLYFDIKKEWFLDITQTNNEKLRDEIIKIIRGVLPEVRKMDA